jgi:hypothetical protein
MKGTEYIVLLKASVVLTEEYTVTVNSKELIGNTIADVIGEVSYNPMSL